jgi:oligopeptide transport system ATP-binding protein
VALEQVGIADAARRSLAYPHEFSGGMRQRAMIAMALVTDPALLIADEPTTALDVTVQAQLLALVKRLRAERGLSVIFVTHDLGIAAGLCDRVLVMYAGRILESGTTADVYRRTAHPYTQALLASLPSRHAAGDTLKGIPGSPPDLSSRIEGCPFAPRCEFASLRCAEADMQLGLVGAGHASACARVLAKEITL